MGLRIGIDLDNTLVGYDRVLRGIARHRGWISAGDAPSKEQLKSLLIKKDGNDLRWQSLQAEAYGPGILKAKAYPSGIDFIRKAAEAGHKVFIISHKSKTSHFDRSVRLRDWALRWLKAQHILSNGSSRKSLIDMRRVFFAATRAEKLRLVRRLDLDLFIDDLRCVLDHPAFPRKALRFHFSPDRPQQRRDGVVAVASWPEMGKRLDCMTQCGSDAYQAVLEAFQSPVSKVHPCGRGGNNRLAQLELADGRKLLLKRYLLDKRDARTRARSEHSALNLLWDSGIRCVPRSYYLDPQQRFTLLSWVPGVLMSDRKVTAGQVQQAADFLIRLGRLHLRTRRKSIPDAAASRRCLADYPAGIELRLRRIRQGLALLGPRGAQAERFVRQTMLPLKDRVLKEFYRQAAEQDLDLHKPLAYKERTLSPSDFGFHNALLQPDGKVAFIDFEYFGRDDAAKLAADFLNHAGQRLTPRHQALFLKAFASAQPDPESFLRRLKLVMRPVAFEWLLIVLNVLAPEARARRRFSDPRTSETQLLRMRLRKAARIAAALERSP